MQLSLFLYSLLTFLICINANKQNNKYVSTLIVAKWRETPIALEAAEYLSDENPNHFWKFIDKYSHRIQNLENLTEKDSYEIILSIAEEFLTPSEISLMKLGLSLRIYSARVEMFSQMAENKNTLNVNCTNFIHVGKHLTCFAHEIEELINQESWKSTDIYTIDHRYLESQQSERIVILYGQINSPEFLDFHKKLKELAETGKITYILRHYVKSQDRPDRQVRLSGYGVELQMKSTEYKATDDSDIKDVPEKRSEMDDDGVEEIEGINFMILKNLYPDKKEELNKLQNHLLDTSHEIGALKVWQFQELSYQAAERIMNSPSDGTIKVLTDISQNFPMQAKSLIRTKVNAEMKKEMRLNQEMFAASLNIQPTDTALFVNGLFFDLEAVDILTLLESLRSELRVMEALHKIGISSKKMEKLLALDLSSSSETQEFAMDIRDSSIIWVNDIENDSRYSRWSPSITELLRPTFPGMLRNIRRNLYNLVLIMDPLHKESIPLVSILQSLHSYSVPLRIGFVFITNSNTSVIGLSDASVAVNNAFHYFTDSKSSKDAMHFLTHLGNYIGPDGTDVNDVKKAIRSKDQSANIDYILGEESEYDVGRHLTHDFVKRSGFKKFPQALLNGVPISADQLNSELFKDAILSQVLSQTSNLQKAVYRGEVTEGDDVVDFIMNQPNVMPRLNERVLKTEKHMWLNLIGTVPDNKEFTKWSSEDISSWIMHNAHYLYIPHRTSRNHLYTFWIVTDLNTFLGRKLLGEVLEYIESNTDTRLSIITNPSKHNVDLPFDMNKLVLSILNKLPVKESFDLIKRLMSVKDKNYDDILAKTKDIIADVEDQNFTFKLYRHYVKNVLNMNAGHRAVIHNGRIIGPFDDEEEFTDDDFSLLERFAHSTYGDKLFKHLIKSDTYEDEYEKEEVTGDIIKKIVSLLVPRPRTRNRYDVTYHGEEHSVIKIEAKNPDRVAFNLIAIVDPVSRGAQKLGPILNTLQQSLNCNIKIFLNCMDKNSDMPLKSFYRFVLQPELQFAPPGHIVGPIAKFNKLPTSSLLTLHIHSPENWLVESVRSGHDLDNIKLDNVIVGVDSEFELEYLLLEGHCFEAVMGSPPRGLQITLGTERQPAIVDTIVMANLGYFQLKANPGEWLLQLRQGRSAEIYDITNVDGQDVIQNVNDVKVLISSLRSHVLKVKVSKKPDKLDKDLLSDDVKETGIWDSISRTFTNADEIENEEEKLNIFSLASGHLYERFLKIMMLSVIKHTKTPVKFWFLKNYLSPTLKDFLPYMSKEYGFEYELVQYKWPRWLHQQTEKQRTIWGYKILFLDVLFPLNVKKIIFVDADQVVRADLKELATMDLGGAPYAYTPFCDSRTEMDGFRFWKQGYWRNHLQGRAYHISALYVVDLKRFRRIAAGDRLRGQYQALSQDPNSLSNLDQDLPNNMIHQVAIKTLPQEWLWCETWCDDKSKGYAKTIDLCNNPMTKEAKLQAAMRILPEWVGYDKEIKDVQLKASLKRELEKEEKIETHEHTSKEEDTSKHEEL